MYSHECSFERNILLACKSDSKIRLCQDKINWKWSIVDFIVLYYAALVMEKDDGTLRTRSQAKQQQSQFVTGGASRRAPRIVGTKQKQVGFYQTRTNFLR